MPKPRLFIGCATESLDWARALQEELERYAEVEIWQQGIFDLNTAVFQSLINNTNVFDFACFIFQSQGTLKSRTGEYKVANENVLFETGLFLGRLGAKRVFVIRDRHEKPELPSDFNGIVTLSFDSESGYSSRRSRLGACTPTIIKKIQELGRMESRRQRRVPETLERGDVARIDFIADASLETNQERHAYINKLKELIQGRLPVPTRYYYASEKGANFWIRMCRERSYHFYFDSFQLLQNKSKEIASQITADLERRDLDENIDFVSLGSGDGRKDKILIGALLDASKASDFLMYYPIDVSDMLIANAMKEVAKNDRSKLHIKGIIADVCTISTLSYVYEARPNVNLFSVLGNLIGNTNERDLVEELEQAAFPGDYILVDYNNHTTAGTDGDFVASKIALEYSALPLSQIGVDVDLSKIDVSATENKSVFDSAISLVTTYPEAIIDARSVKNVILEINHRYNPKEFTDELASKLGATVMFASEHETAGLVLLKKQ